MSWFELRYMLMKIGVDKDYNVYHCLPGKRLEDGLVVVDCDNGVLGMLTYHDFDVNVVLYIKHLETGKGFTELLPDYCKPDHVEVSPTVEQQAKEMGAPNVILDKFPKVKLDKYLPETVEVVTPEIGKGYWYGFALPSDAGVSKKKNTTKEAKVAGFNEDTVVVPRNKERLRKRKFEMKNDTLKQANPELDTPLMSEVANLKKAKVEQATCELNKEVKEEVNLAKGKVDKAFGEEENKAKEADIAIENEVEEEEEEEEGEEDYNPTEDEKEEAEEEEVEEEQEDDEVDSEEELEEDCIGKDGEKILFGDVDEDCDNDSDFEGDFQRKPKRKSSGIQRKTESIYDSDFESDFQLKPKRKSGGRPRKAEPIFAGPECEPQRRRDTYYTNSDSLHSPHASDAEAEVSSIRRLPAFNPEKDLKTPKLEVGMQFESPGQFRELVRQHAIVNGYEIIFRKNESRRIRVQCEVETCPFTVYGSWDCRNNMFVIKTLIGEHNCNKPVYNREATAPWLAQKYINLSRLQIPKVDNQGIKERNACLDMLYGSNHKSHSY